MFGCALSLSLSLSLFFRKCFEVKMRGENHFRVKGENIGQPEVIFRKISFSVTAKHAEKGENDFLKSFSPKTNAPLGSKLVFMHEHVMNNQEHVMNI